MNQHKALLFLIALAAAAALSGCGLSPTEPSAPKPAAQQTAPPSSQSSQETISKDEALAIALNYADVPSDQAYGVKIDYDSNTPIPLYDVEFKTAYGDYEVKLAAGSGEITSADYEAKDEWVRRQDYHPVSLEEAREIVLAKVPAASPTDVHIRQEDDDGTPRYEGSVYAGSMYCEFEIDLQTGIILDWNADLRR